MRQEQQPQRQEKTDLRVHDACLYFIRPRAYVCFDFFSFSVLHLFDTSARLKPLDIEIMKRLGMRVNLIPVIAKADTLTQNDLFVFKQRVRGKIPPSLSFSLT